MASNQNNIIPATKKYYLSLIDRQGIWVREEIKDMPLSKNVLTLLPKDVVESYQIMPIGIEKEIVILVTNLPQNLKETALFEEYAEKKVKVKLASLDNIQRGIEYHYNLKTTFLDEGEFENEIDSQSTEEPISEEEKSRLFKRIENIISAALNYKASDIHLKPGENRMYVLFRIDGRLVNYSKDFQIVEAEKNHVINIIKGWCPTMNISNNIFPEDGSFRWKWNQTWIDCRVSSLKTIWGQKIVIRLLDDTQLSLNLDNLGFNVEEKKDIKRILMRSSGLFFVTGPVGSGKSTTIHAAIEPFKNLNHNTITIENPCEYKDELLSQTQVHISKDKSKTVDARLIFKAILRQDPNTVFFGETRDGEDAAMLITASLSGHRIVTTLHAPDAISGIDRLFDMGVEKSAVKQINGILSQRLLALNCPHCSEPYELEEDETLLLTEEEIKQIKQGTPKRGVGCQYCHDGFLGRQVVAEIIVFNNSLRDFLISKPRSTNEIMDYLKKNHDFKTIWEKGLELVGEGKVKLSELISFVSPNV